MKNKALIFSAFCTLSFAFATTQTARAELIGYWPMDETTGDIATATFGPDATWQNAGSNLDWVAGEIGNAADLGGESGADNFFSIDLNGVLTITEGLTIALWVNPDAFTNENYEGLFTTRSTDEPAISGTGVDNGNWGLAWQQGTGGDGFASSGHLDTRTSTAGRSAANSIVPNNWYHIALVWDGVAGTHVQYINGVASDLVGATGPTGNIIGGVWQIGNDSCCANRQFDGQIDDVAVWNESLSAQDISDLATKAKSPNQINPPVHSDADELSDEYENMFPDFLDPLVDDGDDDVDRVGGVVGGALMPDGLTNEEEFTYSTDPSNPDTDGDGLLDGDEVFPPVTDPPTPATDPLVADTDGDTILDSEEVVEGADGYITNPHKTDTDDDRIDDNVELASVPPTDPTDRNSPPIPPLPSGDDLVALYRFDEGEGTTAFDSATDDGAQDAETTAGTLQWTTGLIGGAGDFNNDVLEAVDAIGAGATAFSISGWVNIDVASGYRGIFMSRPENWGLATEGGTVANQHFDIRVDNNAGGSNGLDSPNGSAQVGVWHHLALTWTGDGVTSTGTAYVDGQPYKTFTGAEGAALSFGSETVRWYVGSDNDRRLNGQIDDVSVWRRELSADEVAAIYRNGQLGIGIALPAEVDFRITNIARNPDGSIDLTWNSDPEAGTSYAVLYSQNLTTPSGSWSDADDAVATGGMTTSFTVPAAVLKPDPTVEEPDPAPYPEVFFKIRLNTPPG